MLLIIWNIWFWLWLSIFFKLLILRILRKLYVLLIAILIFWSVLFGTLIIINKICFRSLKIIIPFLQISFWTHKNLLKTQRHIFLCLYLLKLYHQAKYHFYFFPIKLSKKLNKNSTFPIILFNILNFKRLITSFKVTLIFWQIIKFYSFLNLIFISKLKVEIYFE